MAWARFRKKKEMPGGLWLRCEKCRHMIFRQDMEKRLKVCPECGFHFPLTTKERIDITLDPGTFREFYSDMKAKDNLGFAAKEPYSQKLKEMESRTGLKEGAVIGRGKIEGREVILGIIDFSFFGGSMGEVVGEKITRAIEMAIEEKLPLIIFSSSGGARMQEGALSLMQMAKTSAVLKRLDEEGGLFISVLANPVMGGVMASFASLGDIILAEPGALAGFAGPRVIQATLKRDLPEGFQCSEFLLKHGFVDRVVPRKELRSELALLMDLLLEKVGRLEGGNVPEREVPDLSQNPNTGEKEEEKS